MSKSTPGPWHADANGSIWRRNPSDLYENGGGVAGDRQIATAWKGWVNDGEIGYPLEANARLIAAAPELLEALKYYADTYCEGWCKESGGSFDDCGGCKARAAIARATGEQA